MNVDIRLLRYFLAVADELHFGRAAAALYISQSALSQQIRKLEAELGTELFDRDRRGVTLTDAGGQLLVPARRAVEASEDFLRSARRNERHQRRRVALGFMITWADGFIPRLVRAFHEAHPGVEVDVRQYDFRDTSVGLRAGEMDVSLVHLPLTDDEITTWPVVRVPRVVMIHQDLPLAARSSVTVADLVATGLPLMQPPPEADEAWRRFWVAHDERAALDDASNVAALRVTTADAYFARIAAGGVIGLTEAPQGEVYRPDGVAFVPVSDLSPSVRAVAWRSGDQRAEVRALVEAICRATRVTPPGTELWRR